jgi:hypothetical protein
MAGKHPYQVTLRSTTRGTSAAMTYPKFPTRHQNPEQLREVLVDLAAM